MRINQAEGRERRRAQHQDPDRTNGEVRKPEAKVRPVRSATPQKVIVDPASIPPAELHFGILLRRARERRGLSQQDVARVTRIADRWIPALEEARLEILPAPVFVSGYVRSYARCVGLDESDLLERYHALTQQRAANCLPSGQEGAATDGRTRLRKGLVPALLFLVLLLALCGLYLWRHHAG